MRGSLLNINLDLISFDIIIDIARDLGCNIKEPSIPENKYSKEITMKLINNEKIEEELFNKEKEENIIVDREYKNRYNKFINDIVWWMEENGYMKCEG